MNRFGRRTYLVSLVGGTIGLAGCVSEEADDATGESDDAENGDPVVTESGDSEVAETNGTDAESVSATDESTIDDDERTETVAEQTEIGERFSIGDLEVVVVDADLRSDADLSSTVDSDEVDEKPQLVVELAVKYAGEEPVVSVDELITVALLDGDGESVEPVIADDEGGESNSGDGGPVLFDRRLVTGEVARGPLQYAIDDGEGMVLTLDSDVGSDAVSVHLDTETESPADLEQELAVEVHSFGQGIEIDGIEITVTTLDQGNNLGGFMQSEEGHEIVAVGITVENASGRDFPLSPTQFQLVDDFGRSYEAVPRAIGALERIDESVVENASATTGRVAYQIEDGRSRLYWVFDFGAWGEPERAFWQLR